METVDIIGEVVESINNVFVVKDITDNGDNTYTLTSCDTLHLQEGFPLTISGNSYEITDVIKDTSITISGSVLPTASSFTIYEPIYYHGTVIKVKSEMAGETDSHNVFSRTPFIYLREIIEDVYNSKYSGSPIEKTSKLQILVLTQANYIDWKIIDHYQQSIQPMKNLVDRLILALYASKKIGKFTEYTIKNHVNFGVYVTDKGNTKSIFTDNLSGCELNIEVPFLKLNCQTCYN